MAVKRKASTLEAPNLKRRTRSSGAVVEPLDSLPATPTKVIRTYGSGRTRTVLAQTQRENEADILEGDEGSREIPHENSIDSESGSEDELMLSPSRPSRNARVTRTGTPSSRRVMESVEIITPSKRAPRIYPSRSSRNLSETPDSSSRLPSVQQSERSQTPEKSPHLTSPKMNMWAINPAASNARYVRPCLNMQKRAILRALQSLPDTRADEGDEDEEQPRNEIVMQQLDDLLKATVTRGEGNSCLLLGPRGSGKSRIVERCIANVPQKPIIIRLSGWTEYNDRLAMREIAHQLFQQTGTAYNIDENDPDAAGEDSPFLDTIETEQNQLLLPPPSHLPALISTLPTLSRPTIVILDSFDLFALHPRQALLYCLLDTVQSCRAGSGRSALAVIGITSRLDTTNLLEKRVKSRFSGRTLRTAHPRVLNAWTGLVQEVLSTPLSGNEDNEEHVETWQSSWKANIETFIADDAVATLLREVFAVSKDIRLLRHLLMGLVLQLTEASPYPSASHLLAVISTQRLRLQHGELHALPYPSLCLLIACMHSRTAGHDTFTFEMLYERFIRQVRASTAAPVQVNGGSIGMVRCPRPVMMGAFEEFIASRIFVCVMPATAVVSKEFIKYRCTVEFDDLRKAVARTGHAHLKRWMNKPQ
ncbi:hypothetical protein PLEOSDRAFT_1112272 [Pleurotus ostreatus PC15]|uniref:Uncharacterized protein n=1 Tax=Pleurotus ostreatus (strain PC15) TaxID=1137138 RepID=A0A067P0N8_PLEO1|nr:hypothetical protein PLEOSDRAFT_1112272 [Pleurotus ostreatus PC15]